MGGAGAADVQQGGQPCVCLPPRLVDGRCRQRWGPRPCGRAPVGRAPCSSRAVSLAFSFGPRELLRGLRRRDDGLLLLSR